MVRVFAYGKLKYLISTEHVEENVIYLCIRKLIYLFALDCCSRQVFRRSG